MMWITLISFAVVLGIHAQDLELTNGTPAEQNGTCGVGGCYIDMESGDEGIKTRFLQLNESITHKNDPCLMYECSTTGVIQQRIMTCTTPTACEDGLAPVGYPNQCCPTCPAATREEEECFTEWSEWGRCSRTCGGGRQARVRRLYEIVGRVNCVGDLTEIQECNQDPCPVHCEWETIECSGACGSQSETKQYKVVAQQAQYGGRPCPPDILQDKPVECTQNQSCQYNKREINDQVRKNSALVKMVLKKYYRK